MSDRLVTVVTAENGVEAAVLKNLLESADIPAFLANEAAATTAPFAAPGVPVLVAEEHVEQARRIVARRPSSREGGSGPVVRQSRLRRSAPSSEEAHSAITADPSTVREPRVTPSRPKEDTEPPIPEREQDAVRALRSAVIGLFIPPLEIYAAYLLLKVCTSSGPLGAKARRQAWIAAGINLTLIAGFVALIVAIVWHIVSPPSSRIDLIAYRHPDRMRGVWERVFPEEEGGGRQQLHLDGDGKFRIRALDAAPFDGIGTWGYDHHEYCILFRIDRFEAGDWEHKGKVIYLPLLELKDDMLRVEWGDRPAVFRRIGAGHRQEKR